MKAILTESDKKEYIRNFWFTMEPLVHKIILSKRSSKTNIAFKNSQIKSSGLTSEVTMLNSNKLLKATIDIEPWLWTEGSLQLTFNLGNAKNLVVPFSKLKQYSGKVEVWRPGKSNSYWIVEAFDPLLYWLKAIELTAIDVGIIDNMQSLVQNYLLKK